MKKLNYYLVILFGLLLLACRTDDSTKLETNQLLTNQAKQLFEKEQPKFKILDVTKKKIGRMLLFQVEVTMM